MNINSLNFCRNKRSYHILSLLMHIKYISVVLVMGLSGHKPLNFNHLIQKGLSQDQTYLLYFRICILLIQKGLIEDSTICIKIPLNELFGVYEF